MAVPSTDVAQVIEDCGAAGIPVAVVLTSGFREIGEDGTALQDDLVAVARRSGVRLIGPNCQGVMNVATHMYAGFGMAFRSPQLEGCPSRCHAMGALDTTWSPSLAAGLGFNYVVATGNEATNGARTPRILSRADGRNRYRIPRG